VRWLRWVLGGSGLAALGYGALVLAERPDDLLAIGTWLAGGVILHDLLLAPFVIAICLLGARVLPHRHHLPGVLVLAVFGSVSVVAIPVLGRFGAKPDNATLLDRHYLLGWLLIGALTLLASVLVTRRTTGEPTSRPEEAREA
jgi:hypothetical protein